MTWRQQAAEIIAEATRALPDDTPLPYRIDTVDAARPHWGGCSWPRKAWRAVMGGLPLFGKADDGQCLSICGAPGHYSPGLPFHPRSGMIERSFADNLFGGGLVALPTLRGFSFAGADRHQPFRNGQTTRARPMIATTKCAIMRISIALS